MKIAVVAITKQGESIAFKIKRFLPKSKLYIPINRNAEFLGFQTEDECVSITPMSSRKKHFTWRIFSESGLSKKLRAKAWRDSFLTARGKGVVSFKGKLIDLTKKLFSEFEGIVFCMALGIVVRVIAGYIKDKYSDPAVVAVDEEGRFAISLLSGHEGGANSLAIRVANSLGAEPVVTTASESRKKIVIGIGCRRGIEKKEIVRAVQYALKRIKCSINQVRCIATIGLKQNEPGLREACVELGVPLRVVSMELVRKFSGKYERSSFVKEKIGVEGVSEPCALIAAKKPKLILAKTKIGGVTVAAAREA